MISSQIINRQSLESDNIDNDFSLKSSGLINNNTNDPGEAYTRNQNVIAFLSKNNLLIVLV